MKLHRNAKSTPASRLRMVERVLFEGWRYAAAAEAFAVSERTVAKWVRRFRDGGVAALEDGSSRPGPAPHQTPPHAVAVMRILREQHGLPAWAIGRALHIPRSTVSAWLRRLGVNRPPSTPPVPVQRYEWPTAGDLLHLDIKPLGRIDGIGHRITGTVGTGAAASAGSLSTSRWMITVGWRTWRCCPTSAARPARPLSSAPSPGSGAAPSRCAA